MNKALPTMMVKQKGRKVVSTQPKMRAYVMAQIIPATLQATATRNIVNFSSLTASESPGSWAKKVLKFISPDKAERRPFERLVGIDEAAGIIASFGGIANRKRRFWR